MRIGINGRFLAAPLTGVQRFAVEVASRITGDDVVLLLPGGVELPAAVPARAHVVRGRLPGHAWEQLELPAAARRAGCRAVLHLAGTAPLRSDGAVLAIHDVLPLTRPEWFGRRFRAWRRTVLRAAAPRAAAVITVTEWAREEIVRTLGVDRDRVHVVPQGIEPFDAPASIAEVTAMRRRRGLPAPFLLAVGAGDPRKNLAFLHGVLARWPSDPPPPLVVVGAAPRRVHGSADGRPGRDAGAGDTAAGSGETSRRARDVRYIGRVDDDELRALYTAASALCFPSRAEGFGRPPLEALGCGTPALAADYGAAREAFGDAVPLLPLDPDAWVHALHPLVCDGAARADAVERARHGVRIARWEETAARVEAVCRAAAEAAA